MGVGLPLSERLKRLGFVALLMGKIRNLWNELDSGWKTIVSVGAACIIVLVASGLEAMKGESAPLVFDGAGVILVVDILVALPRFFLKR